MEVKFSGKSKEGFRKHREYLRRKGKTDGHKYQKYELDDRSNALKKSIVSGLEGAKEHKNSIFPKEYEYSSKEYKMYVDKHKHHVVFYKIEKDGDGNKTINVERVVHSKDLKKELEEKGIKPLENADRSLLDDLNEIYKEDDVADKEDDEKGEGNKEEKEEKEDGKVEDKGKEEEVYDEETGKKVKKIVHKGPRGGRYYKSDNGGKVYLEGYGEMKSLKSAICESEMVSLEDFTKTRIIA